MSRGVSGKYQHCKRLIICVLKILRRKTESETARIIRYKWEDTVRIFLVENTAILKMFPIKPMGMDMINTNALSFM
jgi:hypothetical protein